jgi:hypothetical protein
LVANDSQGYLLFLLYVNDLPDHIKCSYVQFADDTLILCANESASVASQQLAENCTSVIDFFNQHKLSVNVCKTDYLYLSKNTRATPPALNILETTISPSEEIKYLGVTIDKKLTLDTHIKSILKKMAVGIKALNCISSSIPLKSRIQLLHAIVMSHYNYSSMLLLGISSTSQNKLEKQLNWALRVCFNAQRRTNCDQFKKKANILNLEYQKYYFSLRKFSYILHGKCMPFK